MPLGREVRDLRYAYSHSDLAQVRQAASRLRASSTESFLADLVEEKLRAIEETHPVLQEPGRLPYAPGPRSSSSS